MVNSSSSASLIVAAAALLISFVCPPEIVNVGLVFVDDVILNPLPFRTCVATTREILIKEKIFLALATLGLNGQQSVLVQFWSSTKAGNTCLLSTCPSFGYYGTDKGLLVYRRGCLRHAFYIHPEENVCFCGLRISNGSKQVCYGSSHESITQGQATEMQIRCHDSL